MQPAEHLVHFENDIARLGEIRGDQLADPVGACPDWDVGSLIHHLGGVHRWAQSCIESVDPSEPPPFPDDTNATGDRLVAWLVEGARSLQDRLAVADTATTFPSWAGPRSAAWWTRRATLETAVHRWDAQAASGRPDPLDIALARDGIDEWLDLQLLRRWQPPVAVRGSIHLHGTDGEGEWLIEIDETLSWTSGHRKGDVAIRGPLSDLYLMMWRRIPAARLEVIGDGEFLQRFLDSLSTPRR